MVVVDAVILKFAPFQVEGRKTKGNTLAWSKDQQNVGLEN